MSDGHSAPLDVIVPVFNAPEFTRRCIASVYTHLSGQLGKVLIFDNASDRFTRDMLDGLDYPGLEVHHAAENHGFAGAVNRGIAATQSDQVLVLNSDVEARSEFLTPLRHALEGDPRLAAVTPAGNTFAGYRLQHYAARAGVIPTYTLRAFAFLIRRDAWDGVGGFDPAFGLGYFEDTDLSRKLIRKGWSLGVVPASDLHHELKGSFRELSEAGAIMSRNRELYSERYPKSLRRVLIVAGSAADALLRFEKPLLELLREGGNALWLGDEPKAELPAIEVKARPYRLWRVYRSLSRSGRRTSRRPGEVWLSRRGVSGRAVSTIARMFSVNLRS